MGTHSDRYPGDAPPPAPGKGLVIAAFAAAALALLVPCLFGWAGILLGLAANQKGQPRAKEAVWTSVATMCLGFVLAAVARKYWLA
ncbi:hypothetical protein [Nocardia seriolae]|uniref:Uncharacterized protein n=1 Tax=Nocardia seriolae TaxID=37332 RepID=A0A0B8NJJ6_9NOCA|nr:hypothetical protein [Nocardia seriolae]APA99865.1 hypothetical protein NS506_05829 [Nocardia seriolae]MTJ64558.1 hypothetical protein [Nocardia seriolae]MTJ73376.1 hypothetical protein [Nocardia seriolae]MTJ89401.1 hypothetical protein [Nocardia seriolae]MTK33377.1 hypothetical protein [Nocardia seriolae]